MYQIAKDENYEKFNILNLLKGFNYDFDSMKALFNTFEFSKDSAQKTIDSNQCEDVSIMRNFIKFAELAMNHLNILRNACETNTTDKYGEYYNIVAYLQKNDINVDDLLIILQGTGRALSMSFMEEMSKMIPGNENKEKMEQMGLMIDSLGHFVKIIEWSKEEIDGKLELMDVNRRNESQEENNNKKHGKNKSNKN